MIDPVKIKIVNAPKIKVTILKHPDHPEKESREFNTDEDFYISKKDFDTLIEGKVYRMMDCLNFVKKGDEFNFHSKEYEKYKTDTSQ